MCSGGCWGCPTPGHSQISAGTPNPKPAAPLFSPGIVTELHPCPGPSPVSAELCWPSPALPGLLTSHSGPTDPTDEQSTALPSPRHHRDVPGAVPSCPLGPCLSCCRAVPVTLVFGFSPVVPQSPRLEPLKEEAMCKGQDAVSPCPCPCGCRWPLSHAAPVIVPC